MTHTDIHNVDTYRHIVMTYRHIMMITYRHITLKNTSNNVTYIYIMVQTYNGDTYSYITLKNT